jgi:hypothetical protein
MAHVVEMLGGEQVQDGDARVSLSPLDTRVRKVIPEAVILLHHSECLFSRPRMLHYPAYTHVTHGTAVQA